MTAIELTDDQRQALQADAGRPLDLIDPATMRRYVLVAQEQFERVRPLLDRLSSPTASEVPSGILRSQHAFWRDLPEWLKDDRNHGKWVCYHGDERVGIAGTKKELIRECLRRNLADDAYDFDVIESHAFPPWQPEEFDATEREATEVAVFDQPIASGVAS